jgi:CheY-like chemotaxis protein
VETALLELPPTAVIYVSQKPDRIVALSRAMGDLGFALLPVRTTSEAQALTALVKAPLILVDLMHPPRGGVDVLERLGVGREAAPRMAVVAPGGWLGVRKGLPQGVELFSMPPKEGAAGQLLRGLTSPLTEPLPDLESEEQADALQDAIRAWLAGEGDGQVAGAASGRHELGLLLHGAPQ